MNIARRRFLKSAALLAASGIPQAAWGVASIDAAADADDATLWHVGLKKQLFFDDLLIDSAENITREFHQPRRYPENPLIVKDKPWEHVLLFRTSSYRVLRDPKDKLFKTWYTDEGFTSEIIRRGIGRPLYRRHYANSEDGLHWVKPPLGIYKENGLDTNIYRGDPQTGGSDVGDVVLDPFERDESKRFKSIEVEWPLDKSGEGDFFRGHFVISYSADGVHWKAYDELPSFGKLGAHMDDVEILNYDLDSRLYLLNTRHLYMQRPPRNPRLPPASTRTGKRRIFQCESSDLLHWGEPRLILGIDDEDNFDDYLYGMAQYRLGDTWIGFLNMFHSVPDFIDVQLAYSLDGRRWKRVHQPWFTPGPPGSWDQIMVEIATEPLEIGDELWIYYGGNGYGHHDWYMDWLRDRLNPPDGKDINKVGFFLGLAKLRLDGFCSLNAGPVREGILITRPLASSGTGIVMNAECRPGGYIEVEVLSQADEVLPGYSRKEFDRFTGDAVKHQLSWQSRIKIATEPFQIPAEPFRRLIFYMRNAKLYSLHFSA